MQRKVNISWSREPQGVRGDLKETAVTVTKSDPGSTMDQFKSQELKTCLQSYKIVVYIIGDNTVEFLQITSQTTVITWLLSTKSCSVGG